MKLRSFESASTDSTISGGDKSVDENPEVMGLGDSVYEVVDATEASFEVDSGGDENAGAVENKRNRRPAPPPPHRKRSGISERNSNARDRSKGGGGGARRKRIHLNEVVGSRIELKWSSGKWFRGTVTACDPTGMKHKVMYDDGDVRWYHLPEMIFRFVNETDEFEWVENEEGEVDERETPAAQHKQQGQGEETLEKGVTA